MSWSHDHGRDAEELLRNIVRAWKTLPGGNYAPDIVQDWLNRQMKPALDAARRFLRDPGPP